LVRSEQLFIQ